MKKDKLDKNGFSILMDFSSEIRNPLNGISGLTNILLDTSLNADQKSLVNNIKKQSEGLNQILELMLDYSKILNGMISNSPEQVFIYPFLQKSLDAIFKLFKNKRKRFCYFIPPQLSGIAVFDPFILTQIINLSSNELIGICNQHKMNLEINLHDSVLELQYHYTPDLQSKNNDSEHQNSQITQLLILKYLE
jgi:signal transduction histidine kinase